MVLIISISLGFVVSRLAGEDRARLLEDSGERFLRSVAAASEEAIISGRPLGIEAYGSSWQRLQWRQDGWVPAPADGTARRELPEGFSFEQVDASTLVGAGTPIVVMDGSGEINMQRIAIIDSATANSVLLSLGEDGRLHKVLLSDGR